MKKTVNFCLFGFKHKMYSSYFSNAINNAIKGRKIFKDWQIKFYISNNIDEEFCDELKAEGAIVHLMEYDIDQYKYKPNWSAMFWRFRPLIEESNKQGINIFRDIDSTLCTRDYYCVNEWLSSDKKYHIIRDHPNHNFEIQAGLWGIKGQDNFFAVKMQNFLSLNKLSKTSDQLFLKDFYYSIHPSQIYVHSNFTAFEGESVRQILFPRVGLNWLGKPASYRAQEIKLREQALLEKEYNTLVLPRMHSNQIQIIQNKDESKSAYLVSNLNLNTGIAEDSSLIHQTRGRFGNQLIRNLTLHLMALKHNLKVTKYTYEDHANRLGLPYFSGSRSFAESRKVHEKNYKDFYEKDDIDKNILISGDMQDEYSINLIYNYINSEKVKSSIKNSNPYKSLYNNNNLVFMHIRLGDIEEEYGISNEYYLNFINKFKDRDIYISSDSPQSDLMQEITSKHKNCRVFYDDIVSTIFFGSVCSDIVLSHGSFTALIGWFAFYSNVYYLKEKNPQWYSKHLLDNKNFNEYSLSKKSI